MSSRRRSRSRRLVAGGALALVVLVLWFAARGRAPAGAAREPRPSLLLVTIDTLRADRVGAYGGPQGLTPALDELARSGVVFDEALAAVPLTLPSHSTILSGLEPVRHGVYDNGTYVFPASRETLATRLAAEGYRTGAFVAAYVLDRRFGLARGFSLYDDRIARRSEGMNLLESERRCPEVVAAARPWIERQAGPFFAWVHLYDPHAPYDPPAAFAARAPRAPYDGEVAAADACTGELIAAARAKAGEALVVAVMSDHGEGLGDHGEATHGLFVYQSTLRIPLLLSGPDLPAGARRGLARSVDVMPTLLGRLGVAAPAGLDGADLLSGPAPREAYAESRYAASFGWAPLHAFRLGSLKLIDAPRPELFDLATDPGEARNLAGERARDVERLRGALRALRSREVAAGRAASDLETAERLKALGYVAAPAAPARDAGTAARDPKDALPLYRAFENAVWADARGESAAAASELGRLVAQEPGNASFRRTYASVLRRLGRAKQAARVLDELERVAPDDAVAWHDRALALAEAGRPEEALRAEERATALNPSLPEPHNHRGALLASAGRFADALAAFDAAVRLDPNNGQAWSNRANVLRALGRPQEAAEAYRRASELQPSAIDPLNGLGVLAVEAGRLDQAAALFGRVLEVDPSYQEARLNLAVVEARRGRAGVARALAAEVASQASDRDLRARARALLHDLGRP
ncbi:MAG: sulfatase-like hydrolase/transferase [Vicinamibacteria bacterium]